MSIMTDRGWAKEEGPAELLEYISTDDVPYPVFEKCPSCRRQVNVVKEKWRVAKREDWGATVIRRIPRFHSHGVIPIEPDTDLSLMESFKVYCTEYLENDPILCAKLRNEILNRASKTSLFSEFIKFKDDLYGN